MHYKEITIWSCKMSLVCIDAYIRGILRGKEDIA